MFKNFILKFFMLGQTFSHLTDETNGSEMLIGGCRYEAFKFKFSNDDSCDKLRFDGFENFYWLRFSRLAKHVDVDNIDTKLKINDALGTSFINTTSWRHRDFIVMSSWCHRQIIFQHKWWNQKDWWTNSSKVKLKRKQSHSNSIKLTNIGLDSIFQIQSFAMIIIN